METSELKSLRDGVEETYALFWPTPTDGVPEGTPGALAYVICKRRGGLLLALPLEVFSREELEATSDVDAEAPLGPHVVMKVPGIRDEGLGASPAGIDLDVLVVDVAEKVLPGLFKFADAGLTEDLLIGFHSDSSVVPDLVMLQTMVTDWLGGTVSQRVAFYSAESEEMIETPKSTAKAKVASKAKGGGEKAAGHAGPTPKRGSQSTPKAVAEQIKNISDLLPQMAQQLEALQSEQKRMRDLVNQQGMMPPPRPSQMPVTMSAQDFARLMGSPPRTKQLPMSPPPLPTRGAVEGLKMNLDSSLEVQEQAEEAEIPIQSDHLAMAVLEQSRALTTLVAHLQAGDPLLDSQATSSGNSSRGAVGREKLQRELASRSGGFMLSVAQNMFRRLRPASQCPSTLEEIGNSDVSMLQYLERFGGFGNCKDMGIVQYALSFIMDMAIRGDLEGVREHVALLVVGVDQYAQDQGRWDLGFQLLLLEDPPHAMWSYKNPVSAHTGRTKAYSPLCPQRWATISLAYTKEIDYIHSRRIEMAKKAGPPPPPPISDPAPKKKQKSPKGKGNGNVKLGEEETGA